MSQIRIVVLLSLALAAPVQASVFSRACGTALAAIGLRANSPAFSAEENELILAWARRHNARGAGSAYSFTQEQQHLALSELPLELIRRLTVESSHPLPFAVTAEIRALLKKDGLEPHLVYPLAFLETFLNFNRWQPQDRVEVALAEHIAKAAALPEARKRELREETDLRREVANAMAAVEAKLPQHRLRFEGRELITPDGKRYAFRKTWGGDLRIEIPYRDLLRTQHYVDGHVVTQYRQSSMLGYWGFEGDLAPDGRFILNDQHHRTLAYALNHPGADGAPESSLIPVVVKRGGDGHFYTTPHWAVMAYFHVVPKEGNYRRWFQDKTWSFLEAGERRALLDAIARDPVEAMRPYYYESTGLTPPR